MPKYDITDHKIPLDILEKIHIIENFAKTDDTYCKMYRTLIWCEHEFFSVESQIDPEIRDKMWDYSGLSEAMTHRLLELACQLITIPSEPPFLP